MHSSCAWLSALTHAAIDPCARFGHWCQTPFYPKRTTNASAQNKPLLLMPWFHHTFEFLFFSVISANRVNFDWACQRFFRSKNLQSSMYRLNLVPGFRWKAYTALHSSNACISSDIFVTQESTMASSRFEQCCAIRKLVLREHSSSLNPTTSALTFAYCISYGILWYYIYQRTW